MKAVAEKQTAVIENERGRSHFAVAHGAWAWIEGGRLHWRATGFGNLKTAAQVWRGDFALPPGVRAGDVVSLVPGAVHVTLYTSRVALLLDVHANLPEGRWSPPVPLFEGETR